MFKAERLDGEILKETPEQPVIQWLEQQEVGGFFSNPPPLNRQRVELNQHLPEPG